METIHSGALPRRVILGMVASNSFYGTQKTNPFRFQPFKIKNLQLLSGEKSFPPQPLELDFSKGKCIQAFNMMFDGMRGGPDTCGLTLEQFQDGCTFFVFDTSQDASGSAGI